VAYCCCCACLKLAVSLSELSFTSHHMLELSGYASYAYVLFTPEDELRSIKDIKQWRFCDFNNQHES